LFIGDKMEIDPMTPQLVGKESIMRLGIFLAISVAMATWE